MRVLHVISAVGPAFGGPTIAVHAMTRALVQRGHSVTLATTDAADDAAGGLDVPLGTPVEDSGVTQWYFPRSPGGSWKFSWPLVRWLRTNTGAYDIVHVHGLFQFPTAAACRIARRKRVPYVLRPLGNLDAWSLRQGAWKKRPYLALVERPHIRHAAALHATSRAEARELQSFGSARVEVIPLGVEPASVVRTPASRSPGAAPLRVLFLSRIHPKKEIPVLLDAVRLARDAGIELRLTIAGAGERAYEAYLRDTAERLGVAGIVTWAGHVAGSAKQRLLAESDVFVLPSRQENFGIAVAEALAAGVPVIVSHDVAISEEVANAGAGVALPVDASLFAAALVRYSREPATREAAGVAAMTLARAAYSWPACAEGLENLYLDIRSSAQRKAVR